MLYFNDAKIGHYNLLVKVDVTEWRWTVLVQGDLGIGMQNGEATKAAN